MAVACRFHGPQWFRQDRERLLERQAAEEETKGRFTLYGRASRRLMQSGPVQAGACLAPPQCSHHSGSAADCNLLGFKWCTANGAMGNANVQVLGAEDDDELMAWMAKLSQFESGM